MAAQDIVTADRGSALPEGRAIDLYTAQQCLEQRQINALNWKRAQVVLEGGQYILGKAVAAFERAAAAYLGAFHAVGVSSDNKRKSQKPTKEAVP